ncbi:MAG: pentapeptide repeat-containing protein [Methanocalculus sp. MSAO_Arc2]|uniref:pentapeptide repeat-containing protein n=1 Tax=Methanocalculus sp. MSAO_Arc2 TaxID=2293855 RepID=UPI000FEE3425|nr:MAG: pentapeptide repeat-containing protein [Methanocalculus sp. MSAO_Arc2]
MKNISKEELSSILQKHDRWIATSGREGARATLIRANLAGMTLIGVNLAEAELIEANLTNADLTGARLSRANLYGANLAGAILNNADLFGANLSGVEWERGVMVKKEPAAQAAQPAEAPKPEAAPEPPREEKSEGILAKIKNLFAGK